jgi:class 3 adenylate cyclase
MPPVRRLTAILAADVAGYSRLMGADEEGTHERLKAHLRGLIEPKIAEHRGRIVKNTGDRFLAEFASVVDSVRCAVEVQRGMAEREPAVPDEQRIRFRIGVNLGDVIVEEHDIFGDGVNVAARLEALAEPGGICVSRVVRDQVRDKVDYSFEDRGEQSVKNIERPVRVYALRPDAVAGRRSSRPPLAAAISQSAGAPPLSIVVLPFANLSSDAEQGYFADGITEDLTTDLSRLAGMFVISRSTAFQSRLPGHRHVRRRHPRPLLRRRVSRRLQPAWARPHRLPGLHRRPSRRRCAAARTGYPERPDISKPKLRWRSSFVDLLSRRLGATAFLRSTPKGTQRDPIPAEDQMDDDDPEAIYRAMMQNAEGLAAERGITQAQAFERLLVAREPGLRTLVKCARGR